MACFLPTSGLALFNSLDFAVSAPGEVIQLGREIFALLAMSPAC